MVEQEVVLNALRKVKYPGYSRDIVSFGLIKDVSIENSEVTVKLGLATQNPQIIDALKQECKSAILSIPGVKNVVVDVINVSQPVSHPQASQDPWANQKRIPGVNRVIAVASGKGGVGKSTCSVNIACALKHLGRRVGILDSDIYGPTVPLMMGLKEQPYIENDKILPPEAYGIKVMSMGFLVSDDTPVIWRGPMIMKAIQQFLHEVHWGELDYLVVDLPPGTGDAQLSLCQNVPLDGGIVVTTPQEASLGVVRKGIAMFEAVKVRIIGIIENMSYFVTPRGERFEIFGHGGGREEAKRKGIPFLGEIPIYTQIRICGDKGTPVVFSDSNSEAAQTFINIVKEIEKQFQ